MEINNSNLHTQKINNQHKPIYKFIALILLISLFLQSCDNSNPSSPNPGKKDTTQKLILQIDSQPILDQGVIVKGRDSVNLHHEEQLQPEVIEKAESLSTSYMLDEEAQKLKIKKEASDFEEDFDDGGYEKLIKARRIKSERLSRESQLMLELSNIISQEYTSEEIKNDGEKDIKEFQANERDEDESTLQKRTQSSIDFNRRYKLRTGLNLKEILEKDLLDQLPQGHRLGEAYDNKDSFFDALAQCLNEIKNTNKYSDKRLRIACYCFYEENKELGAEWDLKDRGEKIENQDTYAQHEQYYVNIQHTTKDSDKCIGGRPWVEGWFLCKKLNLRGICSIEVCKDQGNGKPILEYHLVTQEEYRPSISAEEFQALLHAGDIPILVNRHRSSHFVPLLKNRNTILEEPRQHKRKIDELGAEGQKESDYQEAVYWLNQAAEQDHEAAIALLNELRSPMDMKDQSLKSQKSRKRKHDQDYEDDKQEEGRNNNSGKKNRRKENSMSKYKQDQDGVGRIEENEELLNLPTEVLNKIISYLSYDENILIKRINRIFNNLITKAVLKERLRCDRAEIDKEYFKDGRYQKTKTRLHLAAQKGNVELVREFLNEGDDINAKDVFGDTPLHHAILGGHLLVAKLLINRGAAVNDTDGPSPAPIYNAVVCGNTKLVSLLIENGANVNILTRTWPFPSGISLLHASIILQSNKKVTELLLKEGLDSRVELGRLHGSSLLSPFDIAAEEGILEKAKKLVESGVDANTKTIRGEAFLHLAARTGDLDLAKLLIEKKADINARDGFMHTPLHVAVRNGQFEIVKLLLEQGADVNAKNQDGYTALHSAAFRGEFKIAEKLIEKGADVNAQNKEGVYTALHSAALQGHTEIAKLLLGKGADINTQDGEGNAPLFLAVLREQFSLAKLLLDYGANINIKTEYGITPLSLAIYMVTLAISKKEELSCLKRKFSLAILLLKKSADVNSKDNLGRTPLHMAIGWPSSHDELYARLELEVVKLLLEHGADPNIKNDDGNMPLHIAAEKGYLEIAKKLVKKGADVNIQNEDGNTPLHMAAQKGNLGVLKLLFHRGGKIYGQNNSGDTPLHYSACEGHIAIVKFLTKRLERLKREDGVNIQNNQGNTPLHLAIQSNHKDVVIRLTYINPNIIIENKKGKSPLHLALQNKYLGLARCLLVNSGSFKFTDQQGNTPLHFIVQEGRIELIRHFLDNDPVINNENTNGKTPLHIATQLGNVEIIKILIQLGADINAKNKNGNTPLYVAVQNGQFKVVQLLIELGADVNARNRLDETPLHKTPLHKVKGLIIGRLLIKNGADINAKNESGVRPLKHLHYDIELKLKKFLAKNMLKGGADIKDIQEIIGFSEEMIKRLEKEIIAKNILKKGADIKDIQEITGLSEEIIERLEKEIIAKDMLKQGADIKDIQETTGFSEEIIESLKKEIIAKDMLRNSPSQTGNK